MLSPEVFSFQWYQYESVGKSKMQIAAYKTETCCDIHVLISLVMRKNQYNVCLTTIGAFFTKKSIGTLKFYPPLKSIGNVGDYMHSGYTLHFKGHIIGIRSHAKCKRDMILTSKMQKWFRKVLTS